MLTKDIENTVSSGSEITFRNISGTGSLEWYSFKYHVSNPEAGQAHIRVNDELYPTNISELNSRAGSHHTIPVQLRLEPGDVNTIRFGATGSEGKWNCDAQILSCIFLPEHVADDFSSAIQILM